MNIFELCFDIELIFLEIVCFFKFCFYDWLSRWRSALSLGVIIPHYQGEHLISHKLWDFPVWLLGTDIILGEYAGVSCVDFWNYFSVEFFLELCLINFSCVDFPDSQFCLLSSGSLPGSIWFSFFLLWPWNSPKVVSCDTFRAHFICFSPSLTDIPCLENHWFICVTCLLLVVVMGEG